MRDHPNAISIWFFIGVIVLLYGILIAGVGIWHLINPPEQTPVLGHLHADVWWGILMTAIGAWYTVKFKPANK